MRLGLRLVKGLPAAGTEALVAARDAGGPFRSVGDLARRGGLARPVLARLAAADGFRSLGLGRRAALWQVLSAGEELPLFAGLEDEERSPPALPERTLDGEVVADYDATGLSLKAHPIGLLRAELQALRVVPASALAGCDNRALVRVAGLVLVRQKPPTAKGTVFLTLEDETGTINLVVWSHVWQRHGRSTRSAVALLAEGRVERSEGAIHMLPQTLEDLSHALQGVASRSRDFH